MIFYNLFLYFLFPLAILRLFSKKEFNAAQINRIKERLGPKEHINCNVPIWIHAVSVGEVKVAALLVKELKKRFPDSNFLITSSTVTGSNEVTKRFGSKISHQYLPYDLNSFIKKFIINLNPKCLILIETEIWPNLINNCNKADIPIILLNGRMSQKSLSKYQRFPKFFKKIFSKLNLVVAQSSSDLENFKKLGVDPKFISQDYSLKFSELSNKKRYETIKKIPSESSKKIIVCASTHPGEEVFLIKTFSKLDITKFHLVLIPRHPHRASEVIEIFDGKKFSHEVFSDFLNLNLDVTLVDKMGYVESFFEIADIAFIGGTIVPHGGQNFLEAVQFGLPIFSGPNTYNFKEISDDLQRLQILNIIDSVDDLALKWGEFSNNSQIKKLSQNYLLSRQGAVQRSVEKLIVLLKD